MRRRGAGRRPGHHPRRYLAALGVASALLAMSAVTLTSSATAARPTSGASPDDIIAVSHANPLPGARIFTEPGVLADGECLIRGHLEGDGGDPGAIVQRIVGVDLTSCQITLERTEIDLEDLHNYDSSIPVGAFASSGATEGVANSAGSQVDGAVNHYVGSIKLN